MTKQVAPIPASTQQYLRPWQNPELEINPLLYEYGITLSIDPTLDLGVVLAGPGALARLAELTGCPAGAAPANKPADVVVFLVTPPQPHRKSNAVCVIMTYAEFEQQMDKLGLDSVTTPGFYPFWLEALTGANVLPSGHGVLSGPNITQRLFKAGRI